MHWLQTLDEGLFRFVNSTLRNSFFDQIMPFVSGNNFFFPALLILGVLLAWKGGLRGWLCILMLALILPLGDGLVTNTIKHAIERPRPFLVLSDVVCLVGKGGSGSMPSSHAANWFAATMIALVYYRRSIWFMLPGALGVAFSRVYNGVHYPSDVLAGAILGAGYAGAGLWLIDALWQWAGRKWFPLWWEKLPTLLNPQSIPAPAEDAEETELPELALSTTQVSRGAPLQPRVPAPPRTRGIAPAGFVSPHVTLDAHWLRLGYILITLLLMLRWVYIAGHTIQLTESEASQWWWSKHAALSDCSKAPLPALVEFLGRSLWGDTALGLRFFSPLIAAAVSLMLLRFFAREVNARAGFFLLLILNATPLLLAGAILMTDDALLVLCWTAAMQAGWRAVQEKAASREWVWVGLWMGLGFLCKFAAPLQWIGWVVFFLLWSPARKQLRRSGLYIALFVNLVCALPVLLWHYQHGWVIVSRAGDYVGAHQPWQPSPRPLLEFIGSAAVLLNPVFFAGMIWAAVALWRRNSHNPRLIYFFSMGAPLFLVFLFLAIRLPVFAGWLAPSVIPLLCLAVTYWDTRWRLGATQVRPWLVAGLMLGITSAVVGHNTNVIEKVTHYYLPVELDPLHEVREWNSTAQVVRQASDLLAAEGQPVFIITDQPGLAGELSFYLSKLNATNELPVYYRPGDSRRSEFDFGPGYAERKGQNALFVHELDQHHPLPSPAPQNIQSEFLSVADIGITNVWYHDRFSLRPVQFFACRGLK